MLFEPLATEVVEATDPTGTVVAVLVAGSHGDGTTGIVTLSKAGTQQTVVVQYKDSWLDDPACVALVTAQIAAATTEELGAQ
jgi:hypothetical protein